MRLPARVYTRSTIGQGKKCIRLSEQIKLIKYLGNVTKQFFKIILQCVDVDECSNNERPACGMNSLCKNLPGSYECFCPPNFFGNPYVICEECNSAECQCKAPYKFVGGNCILAGCQDGGQCPPGAECISIAGGVSYCACPKGFRTQSDGSCVDVDECVENQHFCGFGAECVNRPGSYECLCPPGYDGDAYHGMKFTNNKTVSSFGDFALKDVTKKKKINLL